MSVDPAIRAACRLVADGDLSRVVGRLSRRGRLVAADLGLGSWRGHAIARQLHEQLDMPLDDAFGLFGRIVERTDRAGRTVASLIDREAAGNAVIQTAHRLAGRLAAAARAGAYAAILVLAPRPPRRWMPEDVWLLHFLLRMLDDGAVDLVVATAAEAPALPFELPWVEVPSTPGPAPVRRRADPTDPGLVPPAAIADEAGSGCLPVGGGWSLMLPSARAAPPARPEADDRGPTWLRAYRQTLRPAGARDAGLLSLAAADLFAEGGYLQAVELLQSAQEGRRGEAWASLETQAQAMRIAAMDFPAAAARPDPDPTWPDAFVAELSASKAWGLVMCGRCREAEPLFDRACSALGDGPPDALSFYRRNIAALNEFRLGRIEGALRIERAIEADLASLPHPEWHVAYVNAINLARLHRVRRDDEASCSYYRRAFSISEGGRSESDQIYLNLCQSWMEEVRGDPARALLALTRSALHWLSMEVPEALAPRVAQAMRAEAGFRLVADVSTFLHEGLCRLLDRIGPPFDRLTRESDAGPPSWRRADARRSDAVAVGGAGWGVLSRPRTADDPPDRPEHRSLAILVGRLLAALGGEERVGRAACVMVDDGFGTEIPVDRDGLLDLALRHGCRRLIFGGRTHDITPAEADAAVARSVVGLGPGVDAVVHAPDGEVITFRRSRPPRRIGGLERRLVEAARRGGACGEVAARLSLPLETLMRLARDLERAGVLVVRTPSARPRARGDAAGS